MVSFVGIYNCVSLLRHREVLPPSALVKFSRQKLLGIYEIRSRSENLFPFLENKISWLGRKWSDGHSKFAFVEITEVVCFSSSVSDKNEKWWWQK